MQNKVRMTNTIQHFSIAMECCICFSIISRLCVHRASMSRLLTLWGSCKVKSTWWPWTSAWTSEKPLVSNRTLVTSLVFAWRASCIQVLLFQIWRIMCCRQLVLEDLPASAIAVTVAWGPVSLSIWQCINLRSYLQDLWHKKTASVSLPLLARRFFVSQSQHTSLQAEPFQLTAA